MKNIINYLCTNYETLFESEKKIAKYIIENSHKVVNMKLVDLASASGSSEASVSRFCRKIGLDGFYHLKISLAKELVNTGYDSIIESNHITIEDVKSSLQSILINKQEEIKQTINGIDETVFKEVLNVLHQARLIQFVAVSNTIPVAIDGAYKFNQIGLLASSGTIWATQIGITYNMNSQDVVILISNSGESKDLIINAKAAHSVQAKTIAITNNENSSLAKLCNYHLTTTTREKIFLDNYCFSRVSATMMIEILYLFLSSMQKDVNKIIARHEEAFAGDKK